MQARLWAEGLLMERLTRLEVGEAVGVWVGNLLGDGKGGEGQECQESCREVHDAEYEMASRLGGP